MAITWTFSIVAQDVGKQTASVTAVRTDSGTGATEVHSIQHAALGTQAQKNTALDQIWQLHLAHASRQADIIAYVGGLELAAKSNLEERE